MTKQRKFEVLVQCPECQGTGIYVGLAELNGAGVVCSQCHGTGAYMFTYEYTPFRARRRRRGVKRVYQAHSGYVLTATGRIENDRVSIDMTKEGVSYAEFLAGELPKPIEALYCPMLADQSACRTINGFTTICNKLNGGWLSCIPSCKCKDYAQCWQRFKQGGGVISC